MRLSIDAWLERRDPRIRVIDVESGQVILHVETEQVRALMASGDLCQGDFRETASICSGLLALLDVEAVDQQAVTPGYRDSRLS